jgi:hypothetical protein
VRRVPSPLTHELLYYSVRRNGGVRSALSAELQLQVTVRVPTFFGYGGQLFSDPPVHCYAGLCTQPCFRFFLLLLLLRPLLLLALLTIYRLYYCCYYNYHCYHYRYEHDHYYAVLQAAASFRTAHSSTWSG